MAGVQLDHVSRLDLPEEALDRGVPAEPAKMAALIQVFCTEKKIPPIALPWFFLRMWLFSA